MQIREQRRPPLLRELLQRTVRQQVPRMQGDHLSGQERPGFQGQTLVRGLLQMQRVQIVAGERIIWDER